MPKPYHITEYERNGQARFDVGTNKFLTTEQARRMAHEILTSVTRAEAARTQRSPLPESSTVGEVEP